MTAKWIEDRKTVALREIDLQRGRIVKIDEKLLHCKNAKLREWLLDNKAVAVKLRHAAEKDLAALTSI